MSFEGQDDEGEVWRKYQMRTELWGTRNRFSSVDIFLLRAHCRTFAVPMYSNASLPTGIVASFFTSLVKQRNRGVCNWKWWPNSARANIGRSENRTPSSSLVQNAALPSDHSSMSTHLYCRPFASARLNEGRSETYLRGIDWRQSGEDTTPTATAAKLMLLCKQAAVSLHSFPHGLSPVLYLRMKN
jgi:hypothetical protein